MKSNLTEQEKEKTLQEARLRFPVGTEYNYVGATIKSISKITGDLQWGDYGNIYGVNWSPSSSSDDCNVYVNGKWATVIRRPTDKKVLPEERIKIKERVKNLINTI